MPNGGSGFDLWDQFRPAVEDRQDLVFLGGRQAHGHASDPEIAVALQHIEILWRAAQRHRQGLRIAACFLGQLPQTRYELLGAAGTGGRGLRDQPVAITDRPPRGKAEGAADDDRRVGFLHRLRPGHHR